MGLDEVVENRKVCVGAYLAFRHLGRNVGVVADFLPRVMLILPSIVLADMVFAGVYIVSSSKCRFIVSLSFDYAEFGSFDT